jgi:hypothetical protein
MLFTRNKFQKNGLPSGGGWVSGSFSHIVEQQSAWTRSSHSFHSTTADNNSTQTTAMKPKNGGSHGHKPEPVDFSAD